MISLFMRRTLALFAVTVLAIAGCRGVVLRPQHQPFFFIQMSDPQFGMFTANADFAQETVNFERAIAAANKLRPSFVVVNGDLTNKQGDAAQIAEYRRIIATLDASIPLYSVAGNHDVALPLSPASIAAYRAAYGPDRYTFRRGDVFGIVINSSLIKEPAGAPGETAAQDAWLGAALDSGRRSGAPHIMVFQHHSWFLTTANEPDQYFNLPLATRRRYLDQIQRAGVRHDFAGHYHRNAFGTDGTFEMITTGPVGKPLGPDPSGIRIVIVDGTRVSHRYVSLDSIAAVVSSSNRDVPVRVMTYNIHAGHGALANTAATIRAANADIVALQEVDVHWDARSNFADQATSLGEMLGMQVRFAPIYSLPGSAGAPRREYGIALLSRYPITAFRNHQLTRLSTVTEGTPPSPAPGFLEATIDVAGAAVRVFNTHLDYRADPAVRRTQVAETLAIIGDGSAPTLMFGDFNAPPDAPELQPLLERLHDAWPVSADAGLTYPENTPVKRIDYVLTSRHFVVRSARVAAVETSDHRPVVADLTLVRNRN